MPLLLDFIFFLLASDPSSMTRPSPKGPQGGPGRGTHGGGGGLRCPCVLSARDRRATSSDSEMGKGVPFYSKLAPVLNTFLVFFFLLIYFDSAQPFLFPHACHTSIHGFLIHALGPYGARGTCSWKLTDHCRGESQSLLHTSAGQAGRLVFAYGRPPSLTRSVPHRTLASNAQSLSSLRLQAPEQSHARAQSPVDLIVAARPDAGHIVSTNPAVIL